MLVVGDGLLCIHTTAQAISLVDPANLTMVGVRVYLAKGGANETGGEGGHLWKDCYFGPRPSTSQWQGSNGYMFNATRYGTTLDIVTIAHCTDIWIARGNGVVVRATNTTSACVHVRGE